MSSHAEPPIELVSDGVTFTPVASEYVPENRGLLREFLVGCPVLFLVLFGPGVLVLGLVSVFPSLDFLLQEGVTDLLCIALGPWCLPVRSLEDAERLAEQIRTTRPPSSENEERRRPLPTTQQT